MIKYIRTNAEDPGFKELVAKLDEGLVVTDGNDFDFFAQYNKTDMIRHVIVAYDNGKAAGCGAIKYYDNETAEIKRMFVDHEFRRMGIAENVLAQLEEWAAELGYTYAILETGNMLTNAISLYRKKGYHDIPKYGPYADAETSVCMKKKLK